MFRFRHLPVADPGVTQDLEQLQVFLAELEAKTAALEARSNTFQVRREDSGWREPVFKNTWKSTAGPAAYRKQGNIVRLRGLMEGENGKAAFELPAGFRPTFTSEFVGSKPGGEVTHVQIGAAGVVTPFFTSTSLDAIAFTVD